MTTDWAPHVISLLAVCLSGAITLRVHLGEKALKAELAERQAQTTLVLDDRSWDRESLASLIEERDKLMRDIRSEMTRLSQANEVLRGQVKDLTNQMSDLRNENLKLRAENSELRLQISRMEVEIKLLRQGDPHQEGLL